MVALTLILLAITGQVFFIFSFINRKNVINTNWPGAVRHIVAWMGGLGALSILTGLFLALDLLEASKFSFQTIIGVLHFSMTLLIGGTSLLLVFVMVATYNAK